MQHIPPQFNASDILKKNWGYNSVWSSILKPIFHHAGNTASLFLDNILLVDRSMTGKELKCLDFEDIFKVNGEL